MRTYRLTNEPGGLGLSCTAAGVSLAGTPLLRRTEAGFALRPGAEIASLMKTACGADGDAARLQSSLQAIARALNGGEFARAAIAAVLTRTPELNPEHVEHQLHQESAADLLEVEATCGRGGRLRASDER